MFKPKPFVVFIFLVVNVFILYAEAPELKNVMPNSWRKVTRLSAEEQQMFMQENNAFFATINESMSGYYLGRYKTMSEKNLGWGDGSEFNCYLIYKQQAGNDIFYRIVCTNTNNPDFFSPAVRFIQILMYKNAVVVAAPYYKIVEWITQHDYFKTAHYFSLDIIEGRDGAKGILKTEAYVNIIEHKDDARWSEYCKGQLWGYNCSYYFLMPEVNKKIRGEQYTTIDIEASHCLIDPNMPLRYSLQNAFDNDPATSYVENTENDLMEIDFSGIFRVGYINRIAIINGYAQNRNLYINNNRIKRVVRGPDDVMIADNCLSYQFINPLRKLQWVIIKDIYKGNRYNDTCIAELNVLTDEDWLFGDIDE